MAVGGGALKEVLSNTYTVDEAITAGKIVKIGGAEGAIGEADGTTAAFGVAVEDQATIDEGCKVLHIGEAWVHAGATVTLGNPIMSDSAGRGINAVPAAGVQIIGFALSVCDVDEEFRCLVICPTIAGA